MKEIFDILNATDGERLFGYFLIFIITLAVVFNGTYNIIRAFRKPKSSNNQKIYRNEKEI